MKWLAIVLLFALSNPLAEILHEREKIHVENGIIIAEIKAKTDYEYGLKEGKSLKEHYGEAIKMFFDLWRVLLT
ncbi:MAG: hypothetical protein J7L58_05220, partial [Thermoplasmata archaeon]|nr:hypothetical protein [Thermoplasmata archaeon]